MSLIINNKTLNSYLKENSKLFNKESFINRGEISSIEVIEGTIIGYNSSTKIIFCLECSTNLTTTNYLKHLKTRHSTIYKTYKNNNKAFNIDTKIGKLGELDLDKLEEELSYNKYYFKELLLLSNNFKCIECLFTSIERKRIRIHYNKEHLNNNKSSKKEAIYIIDKVPLQVLDGFKNNKKIYFIPNLKGLEREEREEDNREEGRGSLESSRSSTTSNSNTRPSLREISNTSRDLVLESYWKDYNKVENLNSNSLEENKKLLNSYINKSNIGLFLANKNRSLLINLAYRTKIDSRVDNNQENKEEEREEEIDLEEVFNIKRDDFNTLNLAIIKSLEVTSSKISSINLLIRQRVRSTNNLWEFKDFIELNSKSTRVTYFSIFSNLFIFIVKILFIKYSFYNSGDLLKQEYYKLVKDIEINIDIRNITTKVLDFNLDRLEEEEEAKDEFYYLINSFFIQLLKDTYKLSLVDNTTFNNIVVIYFLILNLNKDTREIKSILDIGKITSILIYNSRLVTIGYFYYLEIEDNIDSKTLDSSLKDFITSYLSINSKNYFEFINTLRPYLLALSKEVESTNFSIIETKEDIIEVEGIEYPIIKVKSFFRDILKKLEFILLYKLLNIESISTLNINFSSIDDNMLLNKVDNSIRDLEVFRSLKETPYLLNQVLTTNTFFNKALFKRIKDNNTIEFKANNIEKYNSKINSFIEYLTLAIYLLGGSPLRGTELTSILYKNIKGKKRSLLYNRDINLISISTSYYKSFNITRKEKNNLRYLLLLLSKIIIIYIVYIIPFKEYILKVHFNLEDYNTPYLLVRDNKTLPSNSISRILKRETSLYFNKGLMLASYRKLINYIIKVKIKEKEYNSSSSSDSNIEDNIEDRQSN